MSIDQTPPQNDFQLQVSEDKAVEAKFEWSEEVKEEGGKQIINAKVSIGGRKYDVSVGYNEQSLKSKYGQEGATREEFVKTMQKIVEKFDAQDIIQLSGKGVTSASLSEEQPSAVTLQGNKTTSLSQLKTTNGDLANSIERIMSAFSKTNVSKLISESKQPSSPILTPTLTTPSEVAKKKGPEPRKRSDTVPAQEDSQKKKPLPKRPETRERRATVPTQEDSQNIGSGAPKERESLSDLSPPFSQEETPQRRKSSSVPSQQSLVQASTEKTDTKSSPQHTSPTIAMVSTHGKKEYSQAEVIDRGSPSNSRELSQTQSPMVSKNPDDQRVDRGSAKAQDPMQKEQVEAPREDYELKRGINEQKYFIIDFNKKFNGIEKKQLTEEDYEKALTALNFLIENDITTIEDLEMVKSNIDGVDKFTPQNVVINVIELKDKLLNKKAKLKMLSSTKADKTSKQGAKKVEKMNSAAVQENTKHIKGELVNISVAHKNLEKDDPGRTELNKRCQEQINTANDTLKNIQRIKKGLFLGIEKKKALEKNENDLKAAISVLKSISGERRVSTLNGKQQQLVDILKGDLRLENTENWTKAINLLKEMKPIDQQNIVNEIIMVQLESPDDQSFKAIMAIGGMQKSGVSKDYNDFMNDAPLGDVEAESNARYEASPRKLKENVSRTAQGFTNAVSGIANMHAATLEALGVESEKTDELNKLVEKTEQKISTAKDLKAKETIVEEFKQELADIHSRFMDRVEDKINKTLPELGKANKALSDALREQEQAREKLNGLSEKKASSKEVTAAKTEVTQKEAAVEQAKKDLSSALSKANPQKDIWKKNIQSKLPQYDSAVYADQGEKHGFDVITSQMKSPAAIDTVADLLKNAVRSDDKLKALQQVR